jgi:beta-phosphoglucomutase
MKKSCLKCLHKKSRVEDAISGVQAAKTGGFYAIGIGSEDVLTQADIVFPSLEGLSFEKLNQIKF